jgi:secondary thiamine-phosphate synthase enzyme
MPECKPGEVRVLRQCAHEFTIRTRGRGLYELTGEIVRWVRETRLTQGLLTLHLRHTSASLLIQENADPEVRRDLERFFSRLVPDGDPLFRHADEGPDDMPAHVRAALTTTTLSLPVVGGHPALGTWQGIYLYEHRLAPHERHVAAHLVGE